jgi:hypothetical protein
MEKEAGHRWHCSATVREMSLGANNSYDGCLLSWMQKVDTTLDEQGHSTFARNETKTLKARAWQGLL